MSEKKKLTAKQEAFCREYCVDFNATQAAKRAGYSEDTAYSTGWENLKKPEITNRIAELQKTHNKKIDLNREYVINNIQEIAELAKNDANFNAALKALELLGKHLAIFTEKKEITGKDGAPLLQSDIEILKRFGLTDKES